MPRDSTTRATPPANVATRSAPSPNRRVPPYTASRPLAARVRRGLRERPPRPHHQENVERPDPEAEGREHGAGTQERRSRSLEVSGHDSQDSGLHEGEGEQQRPVNQPPMRRLSDRG